MQGKETVKLGLGALATSQRHHETSPTLNLPEGTLTDSTLRTFFSADNLSRKQWHGQRMQLELLAEIFKRIKVATLLTEPSQILL